jgi:exopolyphosphatase/guanosine-5'-triphosphate,3'-diphosphate pyrophosphatase
MSNPRRAVIDVGTNSVKLLVADVAGRRVEPVFEDSRQTRLGRGFYETRRLRPAAIAQTARAVRMFFRAARRLGAASVRVFATSAARDAQNADELAAAVHRACGAKLEIISGEQEAEWGFRGAMSGRAFTRLLRSGSSPGAGPVLLLDVGGGSTQFILGQGDAIRFRRSYPLGAVRLLEKIPHSDPPRPAELAACREWLRTFLRGKVRPALAPKLSLDRRRPGGRKTARARLVGVGGTASVLARIENGLDHYDRERIEATRLSAKKIRAWVERLWGLSLAERRKIRGMPRERADVLLTGALIYEAVMEVFGFDTLRVTTRGLRFAGVMDAA